MRRSLRSSLLADRTALAGATIVALLIVVAAIGPAVVQLDPAAQDVLNKHAGPSVTHPLGTDQLGRDTLSRLVHGARVSLLAAFLLGLVVMAIGSFIGTVAGIVGGRVDALITWFIDVVLAFPNFLLVLVLVGILGPGLFNLGLAFVVTAWAGQARLVRGLVAAAKQRPHVDAARSLGLSTQRVVFRHVLPLIAGPVVVMWTIRTGQLLLSFAALSFLGLGVQPPTAEWGSMLNSARDQLAVNPMLMIYPGLAIAVAALGFNLLGDGLRDALDPYTRS